MPCIEHLGLVTGSRKSLKNVSFASGKYALLLAPLIPLNFRYRNLGFARPKVEEKSRSSHEERVFLCQFPIPLKSLLLLISKTFLRKPGISGPNGIRKKKSRDGHSRKLKKTWMDGSGAWKKEAIRSWRVPKIPS